MGTHPTTQASTIQLPWQRYLAVLEATSAFIMIRSIFRIAEYIQGSDGSLLGHEWCIYVFDGTLMLLTMVLFLVWHPSRIINKKLTTGNVLTDTERQAGGLPLEARQKKHGFREESHTVGGR